MTLRSVALSAFVVFALAGCASSEPAAGAPGSAAEIVGVWAYTVETGDSGTFTITGAPGTYGGEIVAQGQTVPLSAVTHDGDALAFEFQMGTNGPFVRCAGTVTDGAFDGTADAGSFGSYAMSATRSAP